MSWVKEALRKAEEARRSAAEQQRAEGLSRQRTDWVNTQAEAQAKDRLRLEREEELARLKRFLDERGAHKLLEDIQAEIGGDILEKSDKGLLPDNKYLSLGSLTWFTYGLTNAKSDPAVFNETPAYSEGGYRIDLGEGRSQYVPIENHPVRRVWRINVHTTEIIISAYHRAHPNLRDETMIQALVMPIDITREIEQYLLPMSPRLPFIKMWTPPHEGYSGGAHFSPDGLMDPDFFELRPHLYVETDSTRFPISHDPLADRERMKVLISEGLGKIA